MHKEVEPLQHELWWEIRCKKCGKGWMNFDKNCPGCQIAERNAKWGAKQEEYREYNGEWYENK